MKGLLGRLTVAAICLAGIAASLNAELAGRLAPEFVLKSAGGDNYRLSEYRGQVVLVSFMASWCGECRAQLATLAELSERYAEVGLRVFAIGLDRDLAEVGDVADALRLGFPALHDAGGLVGEQYAVDKMPHLVVIDQDGIVRHEHRGFRKGEESDYLVEVRELLRE